MLGSFFPNHTDFVIAYEPLKTEEYIAVNESLSLLFGAGSGRL